MSLETSERHDYAVYWQHVGQDKFGKPIVLAPIELQVRWENSKSTMMGKDRQPLAVDSIVVVDRDLVDDSILWLGRLADFTTPTNLCQIKTFTSVGDLKGRHTRRVAYCSKYGNTLPTIAAGTGS